MKLSDIIDFSQSYWQVLGKSGGTASPGNDKSKKVKGIDVWKKSPPFKVKGKRLEEVLTGTGLGGTGATEPPMSSPETTIDLNKAYDAMKGKDVKGDARTSKRKRQTLKQYLQQRVGRDSIRNNTQGL